MAGLGPEDMGQNGADFVGTPLLEWFATCGEMCLSAATNKDVATRWSEDKRQDGGGSVVHVGITLLGRRDLVCDRGDCVAPLVVRCTPGHVYLGGLTGPEHQVHHQVPLPGEVLCNSGVATSRERDSRLSLTVMCRTALLAHDRARLRIATP